jgi:hypothetical protein
LSKYYQHITKLPLRNYIDVDVHGNLSALIIEGFPTEEELSTAWKDIQGQCGDTMGEMQHKVYIKLLKEVTLLDADYRLIGHYVDLLRLTYIEQVAKEINKILKSSLKFDHKKPDSYRKDLQSAINQSKSIKIKLDMRSIDFEAIRKRFETDNKKPTEEYYISILIALTNHAKVPIQDTITVFEFFQRLRQLNQFIDQQTQEVNKANGR